MLCARITVLWTDESTQGRADLVVQPAVGGCWEHHGALEQEADQVDGHAIGRHVNSESRID